MKKLSMAVLSVMCLALLVGSALAERQVTVTPVTGDVTRLHMGVSPAGSDGVCQVGNLNGAALAIPDYVWGAEKYKYLFYADPAQCTACSGGFTVESVTIYLQFGVEDVPATFDARVDFEEAVWDENIQCQVPGPEICVSPAYTVTIADAGLYAITLPMNEACTCAYFGYWYGISFEFLTEFDSFPDLVTDATPVGCTSWNDYGAGWLDLLDFGFPGELIMFAEINCCDNPVPAEESTWGNIKAMFR